MSESKIMMFKKVFLCSRYGSKIGEPNGENRKEKSRKE